MPGFPDLADFPDFPTFAEDGEIASLSAEESMMRQNDTAEFLNGLSLIPVTDANGQSIEVLGRPAGIGATSSSAWTIAEQGRGRYSITLGRVFTDESKGNGTIKIAGATTDLVFDQSGLIYLHLTYLSEGALKLDLKSGRKPDQWPDVYIFDTESIAPRVTEARFALWEGVAGTRPEDELGIDFEGWWAREGYRSPDLVLTQAAYVKSPSFQYVPVPILAGR